MTRKQNKTEANLQKVKNRNRKCRWRGSVGFSFLRAFGQAPFPCNETKLLWQRSIPASPMAMVGVIETSVSLTPPLFRGAKETVALRYDGHTAMYSTHTGLWGLCHSTHTHTHSVRARNICDVLFFSIQAVLPFHGSGRSASGLASGVASGLASVGSALCDTMLCSKESWDEWRESVLFTSLRGFNSESRLRRIRVTSDLRDKSSRSERCSRSLLASSDRQKERERLKQWETVKD